MAVGDHEGPQLPAAVGRQEEAEEEEEEEEEERGWHGGSAVSPPHFRVPPPRHRLPGRGSRGRLRRAEASDGAERLG